ncbi:MAG: EAL domain-containing protein [Sphingomonadales bacterium]|nr:EAL domain-containing protein [Sphingomonadales bacterium]
MSSPSEHQTRTDALTALAVLGIGKGNSEEWARLRSLQYTRLGEAGILRIVSQGGAALATAWLFKGVIAFPLIAVWLAVLAGALAHSWRTDRALADSDRRLLTHNEVWRQAACAAALGLIWGAPTIYFAHHAPRYVQLELWTVLAMLMTISAVVIPAAPLATLGFSSLVGLTAMISFISVGAWPMAAITPVFVAVIMMGAIETSRNFLLSRLAEAGVADRNEVVSLLLREFEEADADWLWETDTARRVRGVSRRFAYALGGELEEIEGKSFIQLIAGPAWETGQFHASLRDLAERMKRREHFANLLVRVQIKNEQRWWELSGTPRYDESGQFDGYRGVGSDVTQQRESSDKIAWLARYDTLTGLPNRMMLTEALGDAMRYAEQWRTRCALLMIDLDRFKAVNDTLGHQVGDQLLACVSSRLKQLMTENELCGRLGGDEFAVVIRDASEPGRVDRVAQTVIERLSEPYLVDNHTLYVGASVGSALGPRDGATVETLIRNADLALYRAKDQSGGVHCTYEPSLHAQAEERRKLEFSLRRALERNEFQLAFQPVVDAADERVVSFEALLRWDSPEHGMVSPAKFVPLAEDTRLIVPIGEWVMREACKQATRWPSHVKVAVNVSGEQLLDPELIPGVVKALSYAGLPAQRLEIEVTESIFLRDATMARNALEKIMALGCGVALDDFGTGYSSLGYLRKLHFSTIKVDRTFVQGAAQGSPESLAIIRAVVAMADSLEMSTTAEGVETTQELTLVRALGCRKIQGFYFGRPMSADDAAALFDQPGIMRA